MLPCYIVQPHDASGYALAGPLLPQPSHYANEADAVSYGHHPCREQGGCVVILDFQGRWQFTEHKQAEDSEVRLLNDYGVDGK